MPAAISTESLMPETIRRTAMKPSLQIRCVGPQVYAYSVSVTPDGAAMTGPEQVFCTLEGCLFDAGQSLDQYFPRVRVNFDGRKLGSCATGELRWRSKDVADRIRQSCAAV